MSELHAEVHRFQMGDEVVTNSNRRGIVTQTLWSECDRRYDHYDVVFVGRGYPERLPIQALQSPGCTCMPTCGNACHGQCGCAYCRDAYADFLDWE